MSADSRSSSAMRTLIGPMITERTRQALLVTTSNKGQNSPSLPLLNGPHVAGSPTRSRDIALERVVHHHSVGVEAPAQGSDGSFHPSNPAARQPVLVPLIVAVSYTHLRAHETP